MRDNGAIVAPMASLESMSREASANQREIDAAERMVKARGEALEKSREQHRAAILKQGQYLASVRRHWSARGPGRHEGKTWTEFLANAGVAEQSAREWMALAGHVEGVSKPNAVGLETPPPIPTRREVNETKRPAPPPIIDVTAEVDEEDAAPAKAPRVYTEEERAEIRKADIQRHQPPGIDTREERTTRLLHGLHVALAALQGIQSSGLKLTDATASDGDFEIAKRDLIAIVRFGLDELEGAGVLDTPPPQKRQLLILSGGKPA